MTTNRHHHKTFHRKHHYSLLCAHIAIFHRKMTLMQLIDLYTYIIVIIRAICSHIRMLGSAQKRSVLCAIESGGRGHMCVFIQLCSLYETTSLNVHAKCTIAFITHEYILVRSILFNVFILMNQFETMFTCTMYIVPIYCPLEIAILQFQEFLGKNFVFNKKLF